MNLMIIIMMISAKNILSIDFYRYNSACYFGYA